MIKGHKGVKKVTKEDELYGGELQDIWGTPKETKSKNFETYIENQKKHNVKVRNVMNPKQGHSYNPAMKDHKSLLREVVEVEEKIVQENLKDMKKTRPLLFAQSEKKVDGEEDESEKEKVESEESEDSEDVDMNKPLGINAEIDRKNIKTQAQRNKIKLIALRDQKQKEAKFKRDQDKNFERMDNLIKQNDNEGNKLRKRQFKKVKAQQEEIDT